MNKYIACQIFKPYIKDKSLDITYFDIEGHNHPKILAKQIQKEIDQCQGYDNIILLYGLCGNILLYIQPHDIPIYVIKAHDCLSIFLGGKEKYQCLLKKRLSLSWSCYSLEQTKLSFDEYDKEERDYLESLFNQKKDVYVSFKEDYDKKYETKYKEIIYGDLSYLDDIIHLQIKDMIEIKKGDKLLFHENEIVIKQKTMEKLKEINEKLQKGKAKDVVKGVKEALEEGISAEVILKEALLEGMNEVGIKFKNEEIFVPEVLVAARAMNKGVEILKPLLKDSSNQVQGKVILGTVKGDLHDIGKNLVRIMLEGKGIEVIDLGTDISAETFIEKAKEYQADIICCSALLTTTMPEMEKVVKLVKKENLKVKVMIGGAPVNQEYCDQIGADYYTDDAASASEVAKEILEGKK